MTETDKNVQKEIALYSAVVQAWAGTRMEKDRSILNLSAAGIGLLVTLLTTVGVTARCQLVLYILAMIGFGIAILTALWIFSKNATYLKQVAKSNKVGDDKTLVRLDRVLIIAFLVGITMLVTIGIVTARIQLIQKGG